MVLWAAGLALGCAAAVIVRLALALRRKERLLCAARVAALTDPLTGLPNRRRLLADLSAVLRTSCCARTLGMFDLDGFKAYNDTFGHVAGDRLLAALADQLREAVGARGLAYRLGGDEFCVLLRCDTHQPQPIIASLASALAVDGNGFTVSASYGIVTLPDEADDVFAALHLADQRMYSHKPLRRRSTDRNGRATMAASCLRPDAQEVLSSAAG